MSRRTPGKGNSLHVAAITLCFVGSIACAPAASPAVPAAVARPSKPAEWAYQARLDTSFTLDVEARFSPGGTFALTGVDGVESFVENVRVLTATAETPATYTRGTWQVACPDPCRVAYRFRLADAARASRNVDVAIEAGEAFFSPPSTWLLHPDVDGAGQYRFHVETPASARFLTGVRPAPEGPEGTYAAPLSQFGESSFAGFGRLDVAALGNTGATLVHTPGLGIDGPVLATWASKQVAAIDGYLGREGDGRYVVFVVPGTADGTRGETLGGGGASAFVRLGRSVTAANLSDDWVLPHETIHARFPSVPRAHTWFSEGLASYVEPVARVRAGLLDVHKMWADLVEGMPQGLPTPADRGLDGTREWGRIYWGGALYFLLADLEIRERTQGRRSLEDALRAAVATGANVEVTVPLARLLDVGDTATGTRTLRDLYERMGLAPGSTDLDALWARLGVVRQGKTVRFDDAAPGARLRQSVTESTRESEDLVKKRPQ